MQGATVAGEVLEPGERVLLFVRPSHRAAKIALIAVGVLLAPALFGVVLLAYGLMYDRWALRFVAITNRRLVVKKGERAARSIELADVVAIRARKAAGARLLEPPRAGESPMDAAYWTAAEALLVQGKRGSLAIDRTADLARLGPALARAAFDDGWVDRVPTADAPL